MARKRGVTMSPQMTAITQQADQIRARLVAAQQAAAAKIVEGSSLDKSVVVTVSGSMVVKSVSIDPESTKDVAALEVAVAEALADAVLSVTKLRSGSTGDVDVEALNLGATPIA